MLKKLNFKTDTALNFASLFLRAGSSLMLVHGWKKLSTFSEKAAVFPDPLHIGSTASLSLTIFAEFFCQLFIATGLFTRLATIPPIICMLVIIFIVDAGQPWMESESALVYLFFYLAIFFAGGGKFSLDRVIRKA